MYPSGPSITIRHPFNWGAGALVSGFVFLGVSVISFLVAIVFAISPSFTTIRLTDLFLSLSLIALGVCLFFITMFFRNSAQRSRFAPLSLPVAAANLGLLVLYGILNIVNIYSDSGGVSKTVGVFLLFVMISLAATLLAIALLFMDSCKLTRLSSLALYAALALAPLAFIHAVLNLVNTFENTYNESVFKAGNVFEALTYSAISAVFIVLLFSLSKEVINSRFSGYAFASWISTAIITFVWFILFLVLTFSEDSNVGGTKAWVVFYAMVYISWALTLIFIALLRGEAQGMPIDFSAPYQQAPIAWPGAPVYAPQAGQFGQQPMQPGPQPGPATYGMPHPQPQPYYQGGLSGAKYPYVPPPPSAYPQGYAPAQPPRQVHTPAQPPLQPPPPPQGYMPGRPPQQGHTPAQPTQIQYGNYSQSDQIRASSVMGHESMVFAERLVREYETDEQAADQRYKGNLVEISGFISEIKASVSNVPEVMLQVDLPGKYFIRCIFSIEESSRLHGMRDGQYIRLRGVIAGKSDYVVISSCVLL